MNFTKLARTAEKFTVDNSPTILTAVGVVGTVATAYLTGKASFKAAKLIDDREFHLKTHQEGPTSPIALTQQQKIALVWKTFVLPAGAGAFTITAIVFANRISTKRAAALAAAYALSEGRFSEYKDKAKVKLGIKKEEDLRSELAQEKVDREPPPGSLIIVSGKSLFKDEPSGRYFESTMEDIKKAMNDTNYQIMSKEYAVLTDFYERIGLPPTSLSEEFGWDISVDQLEVVFTTVITNDGRPCICMDYNLHPVRHSGGSPVGRQKKIRAI
jgi:hypothetical protein